MTDDRLSAFLDGELDATEQRQLEATLGRDPALALELDAARRGRELVQGLAPVDPPAGFVFAPAAVEGKVPEAELAEVVSLEKRRRRPWLLGVAAATIFFLVLGFASGTSVTDIVPPVQDLVDQHAAAAEAMPDGEVDTEFELMPAPDDMDDMGPSMPDMPMVAAYQSGGITHFLYDTAHGPVSVFRQTGSLDADGLPASEPMPTEVGTGRLLAEDGQEVLVIERDDVVFTVVGDATNHDMVMGAAESVPPTQRSVIEQIRRWFGQWS